MWHNSEAGCIKNVKLYKDIEIKRVLKEESRIRKVKNRPLKPNGPFEEVWDQSGMLLTWRIIRSVAARRAKAKFADL